MPLKVPPSNVDKLTLREILFYLDSLEDGQDAQYQAEILRYYDMSSNKAKEVVAYWRATFEDRHTYIMGYDAVAICIFSKFDYDFQRKVIDINHIISHPASWEEGLKRLEEMNERRTKTNILA